MYDVDFLPVQYRQKDARRRAQPWRLIAVAAFLALLAGAAFSQHLRKRQVEGELDSILPSYELAISQTDQLSAAQDRLQTARGTAELYTYLRHPWPCTQLLAALVTSLPEEVTFRQVQIVRETDLSQPRTGPRNQTKREAEQSQIDNLPPALRDLQRLRDRCDAAETLVLISGTTRDAAALHRFLGKLNNTRLFANAELDSIESVADDRQGLQQFDARLVVRPGYGQPGGPAGPKEDTLAHHGSVNP
ncbi:MAG: PilN domain-containing protein [Pirellulales bacterium]|nr:PilN domain-containing protein [Pirellulales bacterium]